jgi:hypothetical protein
MTRSLAMQIASVRHCIESADVNDEVRANAEAGLASLEWVERNVEIIREVQRLMTQNKAVITFLRAFPGAQIKHPDEVSP